MTVEDTIIFSFQDPISKHINYHVIEDIPTKTQNILKIQHQ